VASAQEMCMPRNRIGWVKGLPQYNSYWNSNSCTDYILFPIISKRKLFQHNSGARLIALFMPNGLACDWVTPTGCTSGCVWDCRFAVHCVCMCVRKDIPPMHRLIDAYYCLLCYEPGVERIAAKHNSMEMNRKRCSNFAWPFSWLRWWCWCDCVLGLLLDQAWDSCIAF